MYTCDIPSDILDHIPHSPLIVELSFLAVCNLLVRGDHCVGDCIYPCLIWRGDKLYCEDRPQKYALLTLGPTPRRITLSTVIYSSPQWCSYFKTVPLFHTRRQTGNLNWQMLLAPVWLLIDFWLYIKLFHTDKCLLYITKVTTTKSVITYEIHTVSYGCICVWYRIHTMFTDWIVYLNKNYYFG